MSDSQITSAFEGLAAKAEAMMEQQETVQTPPAAPAQVAQPAAVEQPAPADSTPEQVASPQVVDLSPDALVRVKVNGKEEVLKVSDYKELLSGTADYTRSKQTLAEQRRQLEEHFVQREAAIQQAERWIQAQAQRQGDPVQQLVQALQKQQQSPTPAKPQNPNEIVTVGEVQQMLAELVQQQQGQLGAVKQELTEAQQTALMEAQTQQFIAQERARFSKSLSELMTTEDGQMLAELNPQAEALIRFETAKMAPETTEQAMEFAQKVAKGWAEKVRGKFTQQQKTVAVEAARVKMEPQGTGSAPALNTRTKPESYLGKDGNVNLALLRQQAMDMIENM